MQDGPFPTFPAYNRQSSRKARAFLFVAVFVILIGVLIVAGNFFLSTQETGETGQRMAATPTSQPPTPEATAAATPTPTPQEELDKSALIIQVLNGSGTSGAASDVADLLRGAGYTVSSTGNAETFEYEQTVVQIKESQEQYADALITDLSTEYDVSSEVETLAENARFDAIVIVGAN